MQWNKIIFGVTTILMTSLLVAQDVTAIIQSRDNQGARPDFLPDNTSPTFRLNDYAPYNNSKVQTNIDMNSTFYMSIDDNGTKHYSEAMNLATKRTDGNSTYYQPNNAQILEMFKNRSGVSANDFINRMTQNSSMLKEMQSKRGDQLKKEYIYSQYGGTQEVVDMQKIDNLQDRLFATAAKPNTIRCYAKRKLIPKYYCPLNGMSFGARVGGSPDDDMDAVKRKCNSFCKTESLGCRSVQIGAEKFIPASNAIVFDTTSSNTMTTQTIQFDLNPKQKLKWVKYSYLIEWSEYAIDHNLTDRNATFEFLTSAYRLEQEQDPSAQMSLVSDRYPYQTSSIYGETAMHTFDMAAKGMLMFYPPKLIKKGPFLNLELKDVVKKITFTGVDIQYVDNRYFFCGASQVVNDPSTECKDGIVYDVNATDGFYRICRSSSVPHGPEPEYGAYFTQTECDQACQQKADCVETYEDYQNLTDNERYKVQVGCISDVLNSSCTDDMCKKYFEARTMPMEERVYSRDGGVSLTVQSGVQVPGVIRPKIDIAAELAAAQSSDPSAYEALFAQAKKDGAYQEMISKGTYNYSKHTVGEGEPFEYAVRIVKPQNQTGNYYSVNTVGQNEIWWKLKPASADIDNTNKHLYVVAKIEDVFTPASGTFTSAAVDNTTQTVGSTNPTGTSTASQNLYKDILYAYMGPNNSVKPFYLKEYAEVQGGGLAVQTWADNQTNRRDWYVAYDPATDTMIAASRDEPGRVFTDKQFGGNVNYEEIKVISDTKQTFKTSPALLQSQQVVNQGALPIKHYMQYSSGTTGMMANVTFYGIYSSDTLTNSQIMQMVEQGDMYKFYNMLSADKNKQSISGDGIMQSKNVKIFIKGNPSNMTVSTELNPNIEEEDKDVTLFMFLFQKDK